MVIAAGFRSMTEMRTRPFVPRERTTYSTHAPTRASNGPGPCGSNPEIAAGTPRDEPLWFGPAADFAPHAPDAIVDTAVAVLTVGSPDAGVETTSATAATA
jgi:hypothetical protein